MAITDELRNRPECEVTVRKGSARDLVDCFNAYFGERPLKIPKGRYLIEEPLYCRSAGITRGSGAGYTSTGSSTIDAAILAGTTKGTLIELGFDGDLFQAAEDAIGCVFEDFYVYGKGENSASRAFHYHGNAFSGQFKACKWRGVHVGVMNKAAWLLGASGATSLYDNSIEDAQAYWCGLGANTTGYSAIAVTEGCSDLKIDRSTLSNCGFGAFEVMASGGGNHRLNAVTMQLSRYGAYSLSTVNLDSCCIDQNNYDGVVLGPNTGSDGTSSIIGCKIRKSGLTTTNTYFHIRLNQAKNTRIIGNYFRKGAANVAKACIGWDNTGAADCRYAAIGNDAYLGANDLTNLGWDVVGGHTEKEANSIEEHGFVA